MRPRLLPKLVVLPILPCLGCLFTDPINEPRQPGVDDSIFVVLGGCTPYSGEPVVLQGAGDRVDFRCYVEDAEVVRWSVFVDGQERVVLEAPGNDASGYSLEYDQLPRPLPDTLSVQVEAVGRSATSVVKWPVVARR